MVTQSIVKRMEHGVVPVGTSMVARATVQDRGHPAGPVTTMLRPSRVATLVLVLVFSVLAGERHVRLVDHALVDTNLALSDCFEIALRHNADLRRTAAAVVATYGEKIESRGRFLPRLDLLYKRVDSTFVDSMGTTRSLFDNPLVLQVRQRVAEFGRTNVAESQRQDRERAVRYDKENTLVAVYSTIRRTYFALQVIQQQLVSHDSLLGLYATRMEQSSDRLGKGVGLRTAVLTARLNWLDERERILALQTTRRSRRAELKEILGLSALPETVVLTSVSGGAMPDEDSCVAMALQRSTAVADGTAEVLQAARDLSQTGWEFVLDDISFSLSALRNNEALGLELSSKDAGTRAWALDLVGNKTLYKGSGDVFAPTDTSLRFSARLDMSIPVFRGAQRHGTVIELGARYSQARAVMIGRTRQVEKQTREAFYGYLRSIEYLAIQKERVEIARERYALAETQHELGRMSDEGLDAFRERLFGAQDAFYQQQFEVLDREEDLRALIRNLE